MRSMAEVPAAREVVLESIERDHGDTLNCLFQLYAHDFSEHLRLTSDFRILTVNSGFLRSAEANGGDEVLEKLGTAPIFAAISQPPTQVLPGRLDARARRPAGLGA